MQTDLLGQAKVTLKTCSCNNSDCAAAKYDVFRHNLEILYYPIPRTLEKHHTLEKTPLNYPSCHWSKIRAHEEST